MTAQPGLDVSVFDTLIESGNAEARRQLAGELARLIANPETPESERRCVIPCLLKLAGDPVANVRSTLAQGLKAAPDVHPDLVFSIISDEDAIALPFLTATQALDEWMMRSIIRVGDVARQMTLAGRDDLSDNIIEDIAAQADIAACFALLHNGSCSLSDRHYRILYARFGRVPEMIDKLLGSDGLPLDIRILQAKRASNRVHQLMAERGWVPANDAAELVADAEEKAILQILADADESDMPPVVRFMTMRNMLTPSIIMRAACLGEMMIVEYALAHLAGLPVSRAQAGLYGGQAFAFKSLLKNSGLPQVCIGLIRGAARVERDARNEGRPLGAEEFGRRLVEQIMTRDASMPMPERAKCLDLVGRYAGERVRIIANRLRQGFVNAA